MSPEFTLYRQYLDLVRPGREQLGGVASFGGQQDSPAPAVSKSRFGELECHHDAADAAVFNVVNALDLSKDLFRSFSQVSLPDENYAYLQVVASFFRDYIGKDQEVDNSIQQLAPGHYTLENLIEFSCSNAAEAKRLELFALRESLDLLNTPLMKEIFPETSEQMSTLGSKAGASIGIGMAAILNLTVGILLFPVGEGATIVYKGRRMLKDEQQDAEVESYVNASGVDKGPVNQEMIVVNRIIYVPICDRYQTLIVAVMTKLQEKYNEFPASYPQFKALFSTDANDFNDFNDLHDFNYFNYFRGVERAMKRFLLPNLKSQGCCFGLFAANKLSADYLMNEMLRNIKKLIVEVDFFEGTNEQNIPSFNLDVINKALAKITESFSALPDQVDENQSEAMGTKLLGLRQSAA